MPEAQIPLGAAVESFAPGSEPLREQQIPLGAPVTSIKEAPSSFSEKGIQDIATQAGHGLAYGLGDIAALPATVSQISGAMGRLPETAYGADLGVPIDWSGRGFNAPQTPEEKQATEAERQARMPPSERAGKTASVFGYQMPTSSGMEDIIRRALNLSPEPAKTTVGRYVGAGARALPMGLIGGPGTLGPRLAYSVASGMGAQAGQELGEETGYSWAPTAGALIGGLAGPSIAAKGAQIAARTAAPSEQAIKELATNVARDVAETRGAMPKVAPGGQPISPGTTIGEAAAGPRARKFVELTVGRSPDSISDLEALNTRLADRGANLNSNLSNYIKEMGGLVGGPAGRTGETLSENAVKANSQQKNISNLYQKAYSAPSAGAITDPDLNALIRSNGTMKGIFNSVEDLSKLPNSSIVAPVFDDAGNLTRPGNLEFYDRFGRLLRDKVNSLSMSGERDLANIYGAEREKYINALDAIVPEYKNARGAAFVKLGAEDSFDAGRAFVKQRDPAKISDMKSAYDQSIPGHQDSFKDGLYFELQNLAAERGPKAVMDFFSAPARKKAAQDILGQSFVDAMQGRALADNVLSGMTPYIARETRTPLGPTIVTSGALGHQLTQVAGRVAAYDLLGTAAELGKAGGIIGLSKGREWLGGLQNDKKATALLTFLQSDKPEDFARFYNLVSQNKEAQSTLQRIAQHSARAPIMAAPYNQGPEEPDNIPTMHIRPGEGGQADGGRITRATGGRAGFDPEARAEDLMRAVETAKKQENAKTKPLLNVPDEAIVRALAVAKEAI